MKGYKHTKKQKNKKKNKKTRKDKQKDKQKLLMFHFGVKSFVHIGASFSVVIGTASEGRGALLV
jgi:hypothetical protein